MNSEMAYFKPKMADAVKMLSDEMFLIVLLLRRRRRRRKGAIMKRSQKGFG